MTSKECLERLLKIAYVEPGPTKEKFITYEKEIEHNKKCLDLYNIINQDLEKLEKENSYLQAQNKGLKDMIEIDKQINIHTLELIKENKKLKKVIKILKENYFRVEENANTDYGYIAFIEADLTKKQYEFLKEVLGNE